MNSNTYIMEFAEEINKENAEFCLSLSETEFAKAMWKDDDESNKGEKFWKKADYIRGARKYLKCMVEQDCKTNQKYGYSKSMMTDGRLFSQGFSLQTCKKNLRGFLAGDRYYDYDMKNAHFNIIATILIEALGIEEFKKQYNFLYSFTRKPKNRQKMYDKCDMTKVEALKMLNSKYRSENYNDDAQQFDLECKRAQNFIWDNTPENLIQYEHFKQPRAQNAKGSFLNKILCIYENKMLQIVIDYYRKEYLTNIPVATLMFDGLFISKDLPDQTETLNSLFDEEYPLISWDIKPPNDEIEKSDLYINRDELPKYERRDYHTIKKEFEKEYFMILNPVMFVYETTLNGKPMVCLYNQQDFKIVAKPIKYEVFRHGRMEELSIFDKWLADETRRHYKKLDFIPTWIDNPEIYNTFTGFDYSNYKDAEYTFDDRLIKKFEYQVSILTDHEEDSIIWLMRWVADIFQNPDRLPAVCPLLKSQQGWGKDTLIDVISKLTNHQYIFRTAKPDDVFGNFNPSIQNKLMLQLNEMEGKDGFSNKERLKNLITESKTKINQKNMKEYEQSNYLRIIICSNNPNPIEIPTGDRRFAVFDADPIKPSLEHFEIFRKLMEDENCLYSLYQYLMEYDLGEVSLRNSRPITQAYKEMRERSIPPFYIWLNNELKKYNDEEEYEGIFTDKHWKHKKTGAMIITPSDLFDLFKDWNEEMDTDMSKFTHKHMKGLLSKLKIYNKHTKLNGSSQRAYWIDTKKLLGIFDTMGLNADEEDCESDDEFIKC